MKRFLISLISFIAFAVSAAETSTVSIVVNVSGSLAQDDKRGIQWLVSNHNEAIYATNGVPLATNNAAALKTSYEIVLSNKVQVLHASYMKEAKSAAAAKALIGNDDISSQITAAVIDALVGGKTIDQILTAIGK